MQTIVLKPLCKIQSNTLKNFRAYFSSLENFDERPWRYKLQLFRYIQRDTYTTSGHLAGFMWILSLNSWSEEQDCCRPSFMPLTAIDGYDCCNLNLEDISVRAALMSPGAPRCSLLYDNMVKWRRSRSRHNPVPLTTLAGWVSTRHIMVSLAISITQNRIPSL